MAGKSRGTKFTKEQIEKAMQCKNADELLALAKAEGFSITKDEAEAYLAELSNVELDGEQLKKVAGGLCYGDCSSNICWEEGGPCVYP